MRIFIFIAAVSLLSCLCGCRTDGLSDEDRQLLKDVGVWGSVPQDSPACYAVNQTAEYGPHNIFRLRHEIDRDGQSLEQTRQELKTLRDDIRRGEQWQLTPPKFVLPQIADFNLDGRLAARHWQGAVEFKGEYPLNSTQMADRRSVWKFAWSERYLYCAVRFFDPNPVVRKPYLWTGDALELFVCPDLRDKVYCEVVGSFRGDSYHALHMNNRYGTFTSARLCFPGEPTPVECAGSRDPDGYSLEMKIPWTLVPGYNRGNPPRPGDQLTMMAIRTNADDDGEAKYAAVVPLLYGGHNLWGYMEVTLGQGVTDHQ